MSAVSDDTNKHQLYTSAFVTEAKVGIIRRVIKGGDEYLSMQIIGAKMLVNHGRRGEKRLRQT